MGKSKPWLRSNSTGKRATIGRRRFAQAIEDGIRTAGPSIFDLVPRSEFERLKQEATTMDAKTWRCIGSCGCPMTYLGVVEAGPELPNGVVEGTAPSAASLFATGYDNSVSLAVGRGAVTLDIVG